MHGPSFVVLKTIQSGVYFFLEDSGALKHFLSTGLVSVAVSILHHFCVNHSDK